MCGLLLESLVDKSHGTVRRPSALFKTVSFHTLGVGEGEDGSVVPNQVFNPDLFMDKKAIRDMLLPFNM